MKLMESEGKKREKKKKEEKPDGEHFQRSRPIEKKGRKEK